MSSIKDRIRFLHITDPHFSAEGNSLNDRDIKTKLPNVPIRTREEEFERTIECIANLPIEDREITAILITGDCDFKGGHSGGNRLKEILQAKLGSTIPIVAVPGNHDVKRGSKPSSVERYAAFTACWRADNSIITPFLDGVDDKNAVNWEKHCFYSTNGSEKFIVVPINSCNWSQTNSLPPEKHDAELWKKISALIETHDPTLKDKFASQIEALTAVDAALISDQQFNVLHNVISLAEQNVGSDAIKIALIHHHLLPINDREEHKALGDVINLGKLRLFLRKQGFHIILHGHKHDNAVYVDHIYEQDSCTLDAHEVLVISGGTVTATRKNALRFIDLKNLPYAPLCEIKSIPLVAAGQKLSSSEIQNFAYRNLWRSKVRKAPSIISGCSIDEVYERACQLFGNDSLLDRPLICHIEFDEKNSGLVDPPIGYPTHNAATDNSNFDLKEWFRDTVQWWQLPNSKIEARIPYIHGARLYRFGGNRNQVLRIATLLKASSSTSKAVAVLLDPVRDFDNEPQTDRPERFASFCMVQFKIHNKTLECIAYYRAQEFRKWWPVNVAELRKLQIDVRNQLSPDITAGAITTIAGDARKEDNVSPTQVAVPLIDQWLDNYPQKIAAIAHTILWPSHNPTKGDGNRRDWLRCFNDILSATKEYTAEGIPIAIEGLYQLELFLLEFADKTNDEHNKLTKEIGALLRANKSFFSHNKKDQRNFDVWAEQVNVHAREILRLGDVILQIEGKKSIRRGASRKGK